MPRRRPPRNSPRVSRQTGRLRRCSRRSRRKPTRLLPVLDKVDAKAWVASGASDTYVAQLQSSKEQAKAVAAEAKALAANPERLSASLEVAVSDSGAGEYAGLAGRGDPEVSGRGGRTGAARVVAQGGANRDRLQRYIVNLAAEREQDLQVMDREAQRCRGILTQAPPKTGRK